MRNKGQTCAIDGCANKAVTRGWCHAHYRTWLSIGDPIRPHPKSKTPFNFRDILAAGDSELVVLPCRSAWPLDADGYVILDDDPKHIHFTIPDRVPLP